MRQPIRTSLLLSATALFAAACTNMPMEGQDTSYNTGYTSPVASGNNIPEAGPLSDPEPANTTGYNYTATPTYTAPVPAATAPQPVPVATVPQVPDNSGGYDVYAANNTAPVANYAEPVVDYSQPQYNQPQTTAYNDSYNSYDTSNTATYYPQSGGDSYTTDTYANNDAGYDTSYNNTNTYANASVGGSSAVQVFATGSAAKAERIRQDMQSQGLPAVVDQVGGLFKVRVPFQDEGAARANLARVRLASGEAGAFVTTR
ncbi:MAG: SPOR domain-containing protein [Thiolinea sp.]